MTRDQFLTEKVLGEVKRLPLVKGGETLISAVDYDVLSQKSWTTNDRGYVVNWWRNGKKKGSLYLHSLLFKQPQGLTVDHINLDKLDNRRENLRICTLPQNRRNAGAMKNTSSKYKGVSFVPRLKKYRVQIKQQYIGVFESEEFAAKVYDAKAKELFGEYAYLNFPEKSTWMDFSTPEGFFKLKDFCEKEPWWIKFCQSTEGFSVSIQKKVLIYMRTDKINPDVFADAIARFRGWEGE